MEKFQEATIEAGFCPEGLEPVWEKPDTLTGNRMHYCPGCSHGVVHKILMEVIQEMDIQDRTIGVAPVGCSVFAYNYMNVDMQQAAHGRAAVNQINARVFMRSPWKGLGTACPGSGPESSGGRRSGPDQRLEPRGVD